MSGRAPVCVDQSPTRPAPFVSLRSVHAAVLRAGHVQADTAAHQVLLVDGLDPALQLLQLRRDLLAGRLLLPSLQAHDRRELLFGAAVQERLKNAKVSQILTLTHI